MSSYLQSEEMERIKLPQIIIVRKKKNWRIVREWKGEVCKRESLSMFMTNAKCRKTWSSSLCTAASNRYPKGEHSGSSDACWNSLHRPFGGEFFPLRKSLARVQSDGGTRDWLLRAMQIWHAIEGDI